MTPERIRPDPLPAIRPVWEYQADDELRTTYEAYKQAFQVPWVGVVSMAYAHYPTFFQRWWSALQPVVPTRAYVEAAFAVRGAVEDAVSALNPPPIRPRLEELGYSPREIAEIAHTIEVFSHGNFIQGPAVFAARLLLEGGGMGEDLPLGPLAASHAPQHDTPFVLIEPHHASADVQAFYEEIKADLGLPFINTDYRALARWPSYFMRAWGDLRGVLATQAHAELARDMHNRLFEAAAGLPNPENLSAGDLQAAARADAPSDDVLAMTRLFTYLIPGLVVNVAFFRAQLQQ